MTAPTEKVAPIPAELRQRLIESGADSFALALAKGVTDRIGRSDWSLLTNLIHCAIIDGAAILADREARPSLPDSREERIREDEREACGKVVDDFGRTWGVSYRSMTDEIAKAVRARQGGNNG